MEGNSSLFQHPSPNQRGKVYYETGEWGFEEGPKFQRSRLQ